MAVLPYGFGDNDRSVGRDLEENIHAHALAVDESVMKIVAVRVCAAQREALGAQRISELLFHLGLGRPADLVCGLPQVTAGDEQNFAGRNGCGRFEDRDSIR